MTTLTKGAPGSPFSLSRRGFTTLWRRTRENAYAPSFRVVGIPFQPFFPGMTHRAESRRKRSSSAIPSRQWDEKAAPRETGSDVFLAITWSICLSVLTDAWRNMSIARNASKNPFAPAYVDSIEIDSFFSFSFFFSRYVSGNRNCWTDVYLLQTGLV